MSEGMIAKGLRINLFGYNFRLWSGGLEWGNNLGGRCYLFPWHSCHRRRLKQKLSWWIAMHLPKQVALYAFVRVHALTMEAPQYEGEYSKAYKLWAKTHGISE